MLRDETIRRVIQFRDDREWRQFHTPKDLAISLSLEAAELLEIFQWSGANLECRDKLGRIREELADVLSYCVLMADVCGLMGTSGPAWGRGSCGTPRAEAGQGPRSALRISRWRF